MSAKLTDIPSNPTLREWGQLRKARASTEASTQGQRPSAALSSSIGSLTTCPWNTAGGQATEDRNVEG